MTVYIAMGAKKPNYMDRYVVKIGATSAASAKKKFLEKHPEFGGVQLESWDSFTTWAMYHLSKYTVADMIVNEMRKETNRGANWFTKYSSHTSTATKLNADKISMSEMKAAEYRIAELVGDGKVGSTLKKFLKRALSNKISSTRLTVVTISR
jgi:hypothetical protein